MYVCDDDDDDDLDQKIFWYVGARVTGGHAEVRVTLILVACGTGHVMLITQWGLEAIYGMERDDVSGKWDCAMGFDFL